MNARTTAQEVRAKHSKSIELIVILVNFPIVATGVALLFASSISSVSTLVGGAVGIAGIG